MPRSRLWWIYLAVGLLAIGGYFVLPQGGVEQNIAYDAIGLSAVAATLVGITIHRPNLRSPWVLMAAGQASFVIGDVVGAVYAANGETPFPSLSDAFYLGGYPLIALGLLALIRRRIAGGDRAGILDAAILTTGAGVLSWTFLMQPQIAGSDFGPLELAITIAYPLMDLLLIGVAFGLLTTPGARTRSFALVVGSLALLVIFDEIYAIQSLDGSYVSGSILDAGWLLAYLAFGAAVLHPSMHALSEPQPVAITWLGPVRLGFLAAAMLTGPFLMLLVQDEVVSGLHVVAIGSAVLSILVLLRLSILVRALAADVAERSLLETRLSYQANHDPLTGLANRRLFIDRLDVALAGRGHAGQPSVLYIDLDRFKAVNDAYGHSAGDELLNTVAARISSAIRPADTAARLGGDEFGVLLAAGGQADLPATMVARLNAVLSQPFAIGDKHLDVGASIGLAVADARTTSADDLLREADAAMYRVKVATLRARESARDAA